MKNGVSTIEWFDTTTGSWFTFDDVEYENEVQAREVIEVAMTRDDDNIRYRIVTTKITEVNVKCPQDGSCTCTAC